MNYSEPLVNQINIFFKALGSGFIIAVIYEVISFLRILFGERKAVYIIFDSVFVVIASFVSFFFMVLYNSGQVRFNLMVAELMGGAGFHFAFGRYFLSASEKYVFKVRGFICRLLRPVTVVAGKMYAFISEKLIYLLSGYKKTSFFEKNSKKISNIRKILLKNKNKSV